MKKCFIPVLAVLLAAACLIASCDGEALFEEVTIPELIGRMTVFEEPAGNCFVDAVVVTDVSAGSNHTAGSLAVMTRDAAAPANGLVLCGVDFGDSGLVPGDEIRVMLEDCSIRKFRGPGADAGDPYVYGITVPELSVIIKKGGNAELVPVVISPGEIAAYQGMYVRIDDVQSADDAVGLQWTGGTTGFMSAGTSESFDVYIDDAATGIIGQDFKTGSGSITGVAAVHGGGGSERSSARLMPRRYGEVSDLDGPRIVETAVFGINPDTDQTVAADVTGFTFTVLSDTGWKCSVDGVLEDSGTGNGSVRLAFPANTSVTDPVVMEVEFATVGLADNIVRKVTVTQQPDVPYFTVTPDTDREVGAEETSFGFTVSANTAWTCTVAGTQQDSGTGDKVVGITFPENTDTAVPVIIPVVFSTEGITPGITYSITITQAAAAEPFVPTMEVTPDTGQDVAATDTSMEFMLEANVEWKAYLNGSEIDGGDGNKTVTAVFGANTDTSPKSHSVSFVSRDPGFEKTIAVAVNQAAAVPEGPVNMVANPGFESVTGAGPDSWDNAGAPWELLTGDAREGNNALKLAGSADSRCDIRQTITGVEAGKTYVVSFWYKDNTRGLASQGIRLYSSFLRSGGGAITPADELLQPGTVLEPVAEWTKYEVEVTAPAGAAGFNFEIRATKNHSGTVDLCSFTEKAP